MTSLAEAITTMIAKALPQPQVRIGTIDSVVPPSTDPEGGPVLGTVTVAGIAETSFGCDWSTNFDLEISALGDLLVGSRVEVHFIDGQPIIAHSIVIGNK